MHSGILAARAIYAALSAGDTSGAALGAYTRAVDESAIVGDLRRTRNMRLGFKGGFAVGSTKAALATLSVSTEDWGGRRFRSTLWRVLAVQVAALALLWLLQAAYR